MRILLSAILCLVFIAISEPATKLYSSPAPNSIAGDQKKKSEAQPKAPETKSATGTVSRLGSRKSFVLLADGKELTFDGNELAALPAVGNRIDVTYREAAGGKLQAISFKSSKSGPAVAADAPKDIKGKVLRVDEKAKTFVMLVDGKESTFNGQKLKKLPKAGTTITLPASPAKFIFNSCEECNAKCPGVCFLFPNYCRCYLEPLPTQVN